MYKYMYYFCMEFTWHESKRLINLKKHGLDFVDARRLFSGPMLVFEDMRENYGEQRMIGVGLLNSSVVLAVYVETNNEIRIISMREANKGETDQYYKYLGYLI
jgi:uncharacterized DUF497 family protein